MKKRGISIAALAIVGVFVVTLAGFGACLHSDYSSGLKAAGAKFEKLSSRAAEASEIYSSGSKEFLNLFNSAVGSPEAYESISVQIDGKDVYAFPSEESEGRSSAFVRSFSTRIVGGDGADIRLNANIFTISPAIIFYRAKIAFIIILAGTLAACVLLMYLYMSAAEKDQDFDGGQQKKDETESAFDEEPLFAEDDSAQEDIPMEEKGAVQGEPSADEPEKSDKVDFNPLENAYQDHQANFSQEEESQDEEKVESAQPEKASDVPFQPSPEQGLFSPASGFGWESYLNTRLESELVRAASSEQDLSIAIIKIPNMTKESPYYGNVCQCLQDFFQFKDFIFEYKDDGFAAIIQNKDVDQALESAAVLHANLSGVLANAGENSKPAIGLSSRSLRLITAERLKNEAEQALVHASEDPSSPIIAFRVNPEKYRQFMSGQEEEA